LLFRHLSGKQLVEGQPYPMSGKLAQKYTHHVLAASTGGSDGRQEIEGAI